MAGDGLSANMAGMTKHQLFDIMCQMKICFIELYLLLLLFFFFFFTVLQTLIEQNQQQAKEILVSNPSLARALFQAQIMLGMVVPAQAIPAIQPTGAVNPQPSATQLPQSNIQTTPSLPGKVGFQEQTRKQQQIQPAPSVPSSSLPPVNLQSVSLSSHPLQPVQQPKGRAQAPPISLPQNSQVPNMPPVPHHSASLPSHRQPHMQLASSQLEQPMQTSGNQHLPMQPQLPPQVRPSMQPFPHQSYPHIGPNVGVPQSGATQHHHSQPTYHPSVRPSASMGPSFLPGQQAIPSQLPPQSMYQMGGSHLRPEFSQGGSSMQADRGSPWIPSLPENASATQLPGPPPLTGQMGTSNQPSRMPGLTPEMERQLLDQVRSLTPEQINMLPPEQRNQVLQLQQMLR